MTLTDALRTLVGSALSSVEFVQDYVQFRFDGPCLTAYTQPKIRTSNGTLSWSDPGYRDALCSQIGCLITNASSDGDDVSVCFAGVTCITISLRRDDYRGPEALQLSLESTQIWVA
jgi:hypothetical protein